MQKRHADRDVGEAGQGFQRPLFHIGIGLLPLPQSTHLDLLFSHRAYKPACSVRPNWRHINEKVTHEYFI